MILQVEKFQEACKYIAGAVDTDSALKNLAFVDAVELVANGKELNLNVANGEYFVTVTLPLEDESSMRAVVDAKLFLALISKITTKTVELNTVDNALVVKANGTYKFPLKFDVDSMINLPRIEINNPTSTFVVNGDTLVSILDNNTREVNPLASVKKCRYFYLDNEGCVTCSSTSSACVNNFSLATSVKLMLTLKLVKLFKLFKSGDVNVTLGFEDVGGVAQTRVKFEQEGVVVTSILQNDQALISSVPAAAIRGIANRVYENVISFDKKEFIDAIDRLLLLDTTTSLNKGLAVFQFDETSVTIYDHRKVNTKVEVNNEVLAYASGTVNEPCTFNLDLIKIREILMTNDAQVFNLCFGNTKAVTIAFSDVRNILSQREIR